VEAEREPGPIIHIRILEILNVAAVYLIVIRQDRAPMREPKGVIGPVHMPKDWEARFRVPPSSDLKVIVVAVTLFMIVTLPLLFPVYFMLGRKPPGALGIAAIAVGVWVALYAWFVFGPLGKTPLKPPL